MHAVCADGHARPLLDAASVPVVPFDADDAIAVPEQTLDGERVSHLGACLDGRIDQQRVQHRASRAEAAPSAVAVGDAAP